MIGDSDAASLSRTTSVGLPDAGRSLLCAASRIGDSSTDPAVANAATAVAGSLILGCGAASSEIEFSLDSEIEFSLDSADFDSRI
jgi:hypothetical protein